MWLETRDRYATMAAAGIWFEQTHSQYDRTAINEMTASDRNSIESLGFKKPDRYIRKAGAILSTRLLQVEVLALQLIQHRNLSKSQLDELWRNMSALTAELKNPPPPTSIFSTTRVCYAEGKEQPV
jgi:hypothetical protein